MSALTVDVVSAMLIPCFRFKLYILDRRSRLFVTSMLLCMVCFLAAPVLSLCECGYTSSIGTSANIFVFTDLIESDFLHIKNVSLDTDWRRQNFTVTAEAARGPYGMNFSIDHIQPNPLLGAMNWTGHGINGGDPGAQLLVGGGIPAGGYVPVAEMDSSREDLLWGSYRAALKITPVSGTCAGFFWYFNDSQEIDMEFLSSQFNVENNSFPVNLVLQSKQSAAMGFNTQGSGNYVVANLPFNPTTAYHEYRFDFIPGNVIYYADGQILAMMNTSAVPTEPGHMILTQWSNGNPLWSAGPPAHTATMTVSYVKAYFNSSDPDRQSAYTARCKDPRLTGALCPIQDQTFAPDPSIPLGNGTVASSYFFSDHDNMTYGQIVYQKNGVTTQRSVLPDSIFLMLFLTLVVAILL